MARLHVRFQEGEDICQIYHKEAWRYHAKSKSEADKTEKLIKNSLSKNIADAITAVDTRISNHPETNGSKSQSVSVSTSITLDGDEDQPTKKQKISSKEVEEIIMRDELSDLHVNMAQNLLKAQFP